MKPKIKSAEMDTVKLLGAFVVVTVVIILGVIFLKEKVASANEIIDPIIMKSKHDLCKSQGEQQLLTEGKVSEEIEGGKGDKFPDFCDKCLGGDDNKISNRYWIPDDCFAEPTKNSKIKSYEDMCTLKVGCYISDTGQCCKLETCQAKCTSNKNALQKS